MSAEILIKYLYVCKSEQEVLERKNVTKQSKPTVEQGSPHKFEPQPF
jgi:hypothetical protein